MSGLGCMGNRKETTGVGERQCQRELERMKIKSGIMVRRMQEILNLLTEDKADDKEENLILTCRGKVLEGGGVKIPENFTITSLTKDPNRGAKERRPPPSALYA